MAEKAYELGKKLGQPSGEVSAAERERAKGLLEWSRAGRPLTDEEGDHRTQVEKGG